jgi:glyoxylase-like metal-dependent hydrolase (beta-lactamase superfamily II)
MDLVPPAGEAEGARVGPHRGQRELLADAAAPADTPGPGDRSYVVSEGAVAAVIDTQRDIERVAAVAGRRRARVAAVLDTHPQNDYVRLCL